MDSKDIFQKIMKSIKDLKAFGTSQIKRVMDNMEPKLNKSKDNLIKVATRSAKKAKVASTILYRKIQRMVSAMSHKAYIGYSEVKPVVVAVAKRSVVKAYEAGMVVARGVETLCAKVHFDFKHFVMTSGVAVLVFALTFTLTGMNRSKVQAEVLEVPEVEAYNEKAIDVNYGDESALVDVAKDILSKDVSSVHEAKAVTLADGTNGYEIDKYVVKIDAGFAKGKDKDEATITIQSKETYNKEDFEKVQVANNKDETLANDGIVHTYKVKVAYVDTQAPVITLKQSEVEVDDVDYFSRYSYVDVITDNYDGVIADYEIEGKVEEEGENWKPGTYTITYKAKDTAGNVGTASLKVKVNETEKEEAETKADVKESRSESETNEVTPTGAGNYAQAGSVAAAALAQVGVNQDCTMLVTNALKAVGINYHGWPAGYLSLGTVVPASEAQAGDIIYYADGGVGMAHVAVYIGGGQAVHGGYMGSTVVASAYMGSGPVFIRLR